MARRSARLKKVCSPFHLNIHGCDLTACVKRSPTPTERSSILSNASFETAQSEQPPPRDERLPSVAEGHEPVMKTPQKPVVETPGTASKAHTSSRLPQPTSTAHTPLPATCHTPKNRTPILPATQEMHPALHHASTAKMLDEARWLGFQNMGASTAPPKSTSFAAGQGTPSKTPAPAKALPSTVQDVTSPSSKFQFRFRMKSPFSGLSPTSSRVLENEEEDSAAGKAKALFGADEFTAPVDMDSKRKTAVPKGKMKRFSDVHMVRKPHIHIPIIENPVKPNCRYVANASL